MSYQKDWEYDENHYTLKPKFSNQTHTYSLRTEDIVANLNAAGYPIEGEIITVPDGNGGKKPLPDRLDDIIANSSALYRLDITSSHGSTITHPDFKTLLTVRLYRNNEEITDEVYPKNFKWTRVSHGPLNPGEVSDEEWNLRWAAGTKEIPITKEDVHRNASFNCEYVTNEQEVAWVMKAYQRYMMFKNINK